MTTAKPIAWQHIRAPNDVNGNPRRLFLVHSITPAGGTSFDVYDEGYSGFRAMPDNIRKLPQLCTVDVAVKEYRAFLEWEAA